MSSHNLNALKENRRKLYIIFFKPIYLTFLENLLFQSKIPFWQRKLLAAISQKNITIQVSLKLSTLQLRYHIFIRFDCFWHPDVIKQYFLKLKMRDRFSRQVSSAKVFDGSVESPNNFYCNINYQKFIIEVCIYIHCFVNHKKILYVCP